MKEINEIFNLTDQQPDPSVGSLLVAKPNVDDLCFRRSVVLTISHNAGGSMGLITNLMAGMTLDEAIPSLTCYEDIPLFLGGPVDNEVLFYIHNLGPDIIPDCKPIAHGLYIGGDYEAVKAYVSSGHPVCGHIKFILGYSGWSSGQLDKEIARHDWAVCNHLDVDLIMRNAEDGIWRSVVTSFGERYRLWLNWPNCIGLN